MDYYNRLNASALDPDFPTAFELLSARQLQDLIRPSLRYLIVFYAQRNPNYLLKLANKFDELYAIIFGIVEYYHLVNWNSAFTERFYGLKRTRLLSLSALKTRQATPGLIESQRRLSRKQIWISLLFLVGVPYLREKCEAKYDQLKGKYAFKDIEDDKPSPDAPLETRLTYLRDRLLLKYYPRWCLLNSVVEVGFLVGYLFHKTTSSSFADFAAGFRYSRISQYDHDRNAPRDNLERWQDYLSPAQLIRYGLQGFNYALPSALFILKFLEWWNSSEFAKKLTKTATMLPPPAKLPTMGLTGCPICNQTPTNPTVLETGVVYCYKCIFNRIQNTPENEKPTCPVTHKRLLLSTWNTEFGEWTPGGLRRLMA